MIKCYNRNAMRPEMNSSENINQQLLKVMVVVMLQVGGIVLLVALPAILIGLWLDRVFNTAPFLTLSLVVASIPLTVVALVYLLRRTITKMTAASSETSAKVKEKASFGTENED